MKAVAAYFDLKGLNVECMLSPFGNDYIDAVAIREKNFSIADFDCFNGACATPTLFEDLDTDDN